MAEMQAGDVARARERQARAEGRGPNGDPLRPYKVNVYITKEVKITVQAEDEYDAENQVGDMTLAEMDAKGTNPELVDSSIEGAEEVSTAPAGTVISEGDIARAKAARALARSGLLA